MRFTDGRGYGDRDPALASDRRVRHYQFRSGVCLYWRAGFDLELPSGVGSEKDAKCAAAAALADSDLVNECPTLTGKPTKCGAYTKE